MLLNQPDPTGGRKTRAQTARHALAVIVACGFVASCSSTADFATQLGLTQLTVQRSQDGSNSLPASSENSAASEQAAVVESATPQKKLTAREETVRQPAVTVKAAERPPIPRKTDASTEEKVETAAAEPAKRQMGGFIRSLFAAASNEKPEAEKLDEAESSSRLASTPNVPAASPIKSSPTVVAAEPAPSKPVQKTVTKFSPAVSAYSASVLPGVRGNHELFEIVNKSSNSDNSDIDLYEEEASYQVASAGGLARLAPHGLLRQRNDVDTACLKPQLVRLLKSVERHYGKRVLVTSGYRSPAHNHRVRGAKRSKHMSCEAADIQVAGVSRWELARFVRSLPSRGGVGTYCHTASVHVDVGEERDWNWRCRK